MPGWHRKRVEAAWRSRQGGLRQKASVQVRSAPKKQKTYLNKKIPIQTENKEPNNGASADQREEEVPGWHRKRVEAAWRSRQGGLRQKASVQVRSAPKKQKTYLNKKIPIQTENKEPNNGASADQREEEVPGWHCIVNRLFDCYKVSDSSIFLLLPGLQMPDLLLQTGSRQHR